MLYQSARNLFLVHVVTSPSINSNKLARRRARREQMPASRFVVLHPRLTSPRMAKNMLTNTKKTKMTNVKKRNGPKTPFGAPVAGCVNDPRLHQNRQDLSALERIATTHLSQADEVELAEHDEEERVEGGEEG
eukprot:6188296-Pleurochrysis_carterae.AAC.3